MLTQKQYKLLTFFLAHRQKTGVCPSYEEMRLFLGLQSKSSVHQIVHQLIERGYLRRIPKRARALEIIKSPYAGPSFTEGDNIKRVDPAHPLLDPMVVHLPLYGSIPAGNPAEAFSNQETIAVPQWVASPYDGDRNPCFVLKVVGDSMKEAGILDGDLAILKACPLSIPDGTIVAAVVDESEVTLKRLFHAGEHVILMPANRDFIPLTFAAERVRIQGCLSAIMRQY